VGQPFIHLFLVGEQFLDARALLHALEMRRDATSNWGGAVAIPKEMRVQRDKMVEALRVDIKKVFNSLLFVGSSRRELLNSTSTTSYSRSPRRPAARAAWPRRFFADGGRAYRRRCRR
jgi:hypothetical protein